MARVVAVVGVVAITIAIGVAKACPLEYTQY